MSDYIHYDYEYKIRNVKLYCTDKISDKEAEAYIKRGLETQGIMLKEVYAKIDEDYVDLSYVVAEHIPFSRIRRITGYLVGTLDRFNDGKRAEESDRVKHSVER